MFSIEEAGALLEALPRFRARHKADEDYTLPRAFRDVLTERGIDREGVDDAVARLVRLRPAQVIALLDRFESGAEAERREALQPRGKTARECGINA